MVELGAIVGDMAGTLGKIVIFLVVMAACYMGTKQLMKFRKKKKSFKVTCVISNPDGSHYVDYIGKFNDTDKMEKMMFRIRKSETCPVINPKYIVNGSVHLFRYGPGEFAIIPPTVYRSLDPKHFNIKLINMNMLAFKGMEQRAAISRWQTKKDKLQQLAPWITIIICVGCALGAIYLASQASSQMFKDGIAARTAECSELVPIEDISKAVAEAVIDSQTDVYSNIDTKQVSVPV